MLQQKDQVLGLFLDKELKSREKLLERLEQKPGMNKERLEQLAAEKCMLEQAVWMIRE